MSYTRFCQLDTVCTGLPSGITVGLTHGTALPPTTQFPVAISSMIKCCGERPLLLPTVLFPATATATE